MVILLVRCEWPFTLSNASSKSSCSGSNVVASSEIHLNRSRESASGRPAFNLSLLTALSASKTGGALERVTKGPYGLPYFQNNLSKIDQFNHVSGVTYKTPKVRCT